MPAYLIVKSDTSKINKEHFDHWYKTEHLHEAMVKFMAISAKRGWLKNSNFHIAIYEFENINKAQKAMESKNLKSLVKKFDQKWDCKVNRPRELIDLKQVI